MLYEMAFRQKLFDSDLALLDYVYKKRKLAIARLGRPAEETIMIKPVLDKTLALNPVIRPTANSLRAACNRACRWHSQIISMEDSKDVAFDIVDLLKGSQGPNIGFSGIDTR